MIAVGNGTAVKIDVSTGIEHDNKVEVTGEIKNEDKLIINANDE